MNRHTFIVVLLLALGASQVVVAQDSNSAAGPDWKAFQALAQKNIFDPTRSGRAARTIRRTRPPVVRTFTFCGTVDDKIAIFTGEGSGKGYLKAGDSINGFKVMKIPVSYTDPTVILTDTTGAIVRLKAGQNMRREENGPWKKSDEPAPVAEVATEAKAGDSAASSAPGPAGESEILKRLRLKREQEDK